MTFRQLFYSVFLLALVLPYAGAAQTTPPEEDTSYLIPPEVTQALTPALIEKLKTGGYTIFFRHAHRDMLEGQEALDRAEMLEGFSLKGKFKRGICLTDLGESQAAIIGHVFRQHEIPVGKIYTSPLCRAKETAWIAFGRIDSIVPGLVLNGPFSEEEREKIRPAAKEVVFTRPAAGTNTVISSHRHMLKPLDIDYDAQLKQGSCVVLEHKDDGMVTVIAHLDVSDFAESLPVDLTVRPFEAGP